MIQNKRYFLGILLPNKESKLIRSWQEKFDHEIYRRPPPHITIGFNTFEKSKIKDLVPRFKDIFSMYPKFHLKSVGINIFRNEKSVLHLEIKKTNDLAKIHEEIVSLGADSRPQFNPHITIAKLNGEKLRAAREYIDNQPTKFEFDSSEIGLFEERASGPWEQVDTF